MKKPFADTADYLSRHDIVYKTPAMEGWEAFPLGNGSLGGPLWSLPDGLIFQINHTDAYELPDTQGSEDKREQVLLRSMWTANDPACGSLF